MVGGFVKRGESSRRSLPASAGKAAEDCAHSKTLREVRKHSNNREVMECASPRPLWLRTKSGPSLRSGCSLCFEPAPALPKVIPCVIMELSEDHSCHIGVRLLDLSFAVWCCWRCRAELRPLTPPRSATNSCLGIRRGTLAAETVQP